MVTTFDVASDVIKNSDKLDSIFTIDLLYGKNVFETISIPFNILNASFYTKTELRNIFEFLDEKFESLQKQAFTGIKISIFVKPGKKREVTHFRREITIQEIRMLIEDMKEQFINEIVVRSVMDTLAKIIE